MRFWPLAHWCGAGHSTSSSSALSVWGSHRFLTKCDTGTKYGAVDIKIWGKYMGHRYHDFVGVPYKTDYVYLVIQLTKSKTPPHCGRSAGALRVEWPMNEPFSDIRIWLIRPLGHLNIEFIRIFKITYKMTHNEEKSIENCQKYHIFPVVKLI